MRSSFSIVVLIYGLITFLTGVAYGDYTLSLNVPQYGQDTSYYCGAASGQMMMNGYPDVTRRQCFTQDNIYNTIQSNKQDYDFYTDPDGLRDAVMSLNAPPAPGRYSIFSNTDRNIVMHDILYWMAKRSYPSATLINHGAHWVTISGFTTDVDPQTGDAELKTIDINNPAPPDTAPHDDPCTTADEGNEGGIIRHITGTSWFSNDWKDANTYGTKWLNMYIAIVEPPEIKGKVWAKGEKEKGEVISNQKAIRLAERYIKERGLSEKKQFAFLKKTKPLKALLTNKAYYIVPFEDVDGRSRGAVIINAYSGDFQEIGAFSQPLIYLTEDSAIKVALCSLRVEPVKKPIAELVFKTSEQIKSRYHPIWKITVPLKNTSTIRYVNNLGEVFAELTPQLFGGD